MDIKPATNSALGMFQQQFKDKLPYFAFNIAPQFTRSVPGVVDGT